MDKIYFGFQGSLLKYSEFFWSTIVQTLEARIEAKARTAIRVLLLPSLLYICFLHEVPDYKD